MSVGLDVNEVTCEEEAGDRGNTVESAALIGIPTLDLCRLTG